MDLVFDACGRWPVPDGAVSEVYSSHTLEHLPDALAFFREAWRVLEPNGRLRIRVPYGWSNACWWDPTHLRPWLQEGFAFLQPGYSMFSRNHQQEDFRFAFWINACVLVLCAGWARLWWWRPLRRFVLFAGRHWLNVFKELYVEAWKTTLDDSHSVTYGGTRMPHVVPCAIGVMSKEYYGWDWLHRFRMGSTGEKQCMMIWGEDQPKWAGKFGESKL